MQRFFFSWEIPSNRGITIQAAAGMQGMYRDNKVVLYDDCALLQMATLNVFQVPLYKRLYKYYYYTCEKKINNKNEYLATVNYVLL